MTPSKSPQTSAARRLHFAVGIRVAGQARRFHRLLADDRRAPGDEFANLAQHLGRIWSISGSTSTRLAHAIGQHQPAVGAYRQGG